MTMHEPPSSLVRVYENPAGKAARSARGTNRKAVEMFEQALHHWPGWADFRSHEDCLGDAYLQLGQFPEAIAEYKRVLDAFPRRRLKSLVLDGVSSPITKRVYNLALDEFIAW